MPGNVKGKVDISSISDSLEKLFKNLVKDLKKGHDVSGFLCILFASQLFTANTLSFFQYT